ncbi:response regulator [Leptolyngbya sp. FACHB-321]|uniref:hybrid sensor histidine kinase/response regulator n=1 Tax=Leptolyngbya sp. FACHB-321 TaxID=2692807 RepID=UPI0016867ABC|nr:response regulator [Leptolyngbya sp. FACHB-321]MBD2036028.1 response regulator [Leptolyngbya sp. FACHB-321]
MAEPQLTVLHVDDSEANRYVVARILRNGGFTVVEAATGAAGLAAIAAHQPALVILDVKLPDLNGFEVCRQIKSNPDSEFLPVLHLSASFVQSQDKAEGLDSGADAYLVQPVEPIELLATVRSLLRIRRAEETALASARDWQTTFDAINDGVCLVDPDGKVIRCNQAMSQLFGKPFNEILGRVHYELMRGVLGLGDGTCFQQAQATHQRQVLELQAKGRWFAKTMDPVLDGQGTFTGAVFILADITARKQAEAALQESEALKQRILESSKDCIKVLTLDGRILYLNKGALQLLEVDNPTSLLGVEWFSFWQGEDKDKAKGAIAAAKAGNSGQFQGFCPTAKGTLKWWDVVVTPVQDALGQVTQLLVVSRDMTRQKQAIAEREQLLIREQEAREQAETANRIKDEFLAVLSHELRSPLNPILGWARILQTSQQDAVKTQYALETIERNARLQAQLIEDLLDVSRILQGKLSLHTDSVGLTFTIKAALETVRLAAEAKAIQIKTVFAPNVGQVLGDASRLQQVVWNLLTNAVKFTKQGGQVEVRLEEVRSGEEDIGQGEMPHSSRPTSHALTYAQITVSDTGKGISSDFLPHVFEYFRQADSTTTRSFGGLGLGLAIVRYLVELHGGTVQAESPGEEQGATFRVRLPILEASSLNQADTLPHEHSKFNLNGLEVLFVDDDRDSRELIAFVLQQHGANVTEVESASEALNHLSHATFDLLISDIGMPTMDGYALVRHIRARSPQQGGQIPAIALTAYAGEIDQQQAITAGFQQHLTKPIEPELLMQAIWTLMQANGKGTAAKFG